jgi:DNA (cytosine-5)-methyltransferase 1
MPRQRPGKSEQDVGTPPAFVTAASAYVGGAIAWDLAATQHNRVTYRYLGPSSTAGEDALAVSWHRLPRKPGEWLWLNPPFGNIAPWAAKCAAEAWLGAPILLLVPAAVGSNWFNDYVFGKADVMAFRPRLTFVGQEDPYPKDCVLCVFRPGAVPLQPFMTWKWDASMEAAA